MIEDTLELSKQDIERFFLQSIKKYFRIRPEAFNTLMEGLRLFRDIIIEYETLHNRIEKSKQISYIIRELDKLVEVEYIG